MQNAGVRNTVSALAKVTRPSAPLIGRRELVATIADGNAALTWIVAPGGSGKTSLGLEYTATQDCPVAWLRLDEADRDPASFLHYFELAAANAGAILGEWHKPPLLREHLPAPQGYLRLFVRSLAECIAGN